VNANHFGGFSNTKGHDTQILPSIITDQFQIVCSNSVELGVSSNPSSDGCLMEGAKMGEKHESVPMVDRLTDAFFSLDTSWRFTYLNDRAETLLKRSRSELLGRVMWDEFPETVETQFPDGFYQAMDEQVPVSFEVYHTPLETWLEAQASPSESGLSVYMRDITERKRRETTLAQQSAVVEGIKDGVFAIDRQNRIVSVNAAVETELGIDRTALVGEHIATLTELVEIDDECALELGQAIGELNTGNASYRSVEMSFTDAAGETRVGELRLIRIDDKHARIAGILRDITDRREHERIVGSLHELTRWLLRSDDPEEICAIAVHAGSDLLDLPISGVWLLDDEHGYLDPVAGTAGAHDEFGGLPRFNPGEGLIWKTFEDGEPVLYDDLETADGIYNPESPIQSEIIAPIGTEGVLMTGAKEPHAFDETDLELLSTLVENTRAALDRADRERVLRERSEKLEQQTKRLEAVATVISEDLKKELSAVADELERDEPSDWSFPMAEEGVKSTLDRAERLIDDVREFARNASSVGRRTQINFESAVADAAKASRLEPTSVVVEQPATIRVDPDRFGHLLETVFNDAAARATDDISVRVGLLAFETSDTPRGFYIHDDAPEIPPAAHERVLEPVSAYSDPIKIDGLRLAVARVIAEAHNWSVTIMNDERGGTRIEIRDVPTLEPKQSTNPTQ